MLEKWPFLDQNHGLTPLEKCQFFDFFESLVSIASKGVFSFKNWYRNRHFPGLYCLKKRMLEKFAFLDQNHGLSPDVAKMAIFGKMSIFFFWTSCFYSLESCFFVVKYRKRHFPGLYCPKKNVEKMAIFGPKPWVNPFENMSIFRLFERLVFIA